ncbi:MAG: adenylate/guanylate cyclase domain-containing protein [Pseudomonadota bacterium]
MIRRLLPFIYGIVALVLLVGIRISDPKIVEQARLWTFDFYQQVEPRRYNEAGVRIVDVDEESLGRFGQWPWPRALVGQLVTNLTQAGAAAVVFDMVFAEEDRLHPRSIGEAMRLSGVDADVGPLLDQMPDPDEGFAQTIAGLPVVTGFAPHATESTRSPARPAGIAINGPDPSGSLEAFAGAATNLEVIQGTALGNGSFAVRNDTDTILRRVPLFQVVEGEIYPTLAAEALRVAQRARTHLIKTAALDDGTASMVAAKIGAVEVPTTRTGEVVLHDTGFVPQRYVPAWKVLDPSELPDITPLVGGHIVLIGTSAAGLKDLRSTPLSANVPGVSLHAQALEQIVLGHHLERPDWAEGLEVLAFIATGVVLIIALPLLGATWSALLGLLAMGAAVGTSWYAFTEWRLLLDPVYPILATIGVYLPTTAVMMMQTEAERRFVRGAFSRYLSPELVKRIAADPDSLALGGEDREITLIFSDIRSFTTLSETMAPEELIHFMNRYFTPMSDEILRQDGYIDKYIGDAIMAFWNAPLDVPEHPTRACHAAIAMRRALAVLNDTLAAEAAEAGKPFNPIRIGIGLHTGVCRVGNMGSSDRFNYSALGDDVNVTSRLEGQTKLFGVDVLVSDAVVERIGNEFATVELDTVSVKGRAQPVRIFALVGYAADVASPGFERYAAAQSALVAAYRAKDWDAADACLHQVFRALAKSDDWRAATLNLQVTAELYAGRIAAHRLDPETGAYPDELDDTVPSPLPATAG